jgi:hypothetical protein
MQPFALTTNGGGVEIAEIHVTAGWVTEGAEVDWSTLHMTVTMEVREYLANDYLVYHTVSLSETGLQSGSLSFVVTESDITEVKDGEEHDLVFFCIFDASVQATTGEVIYTSDSMGSSGFRVSIAPDQDPYITVTGTVGYDGSMNIIAFSTTEAGLNPIENPALATLIVGIGLIVAQLVTGKGKR